MKLKGIPASQGVAFSKIFLIEEPEIKIENTKIEKIDEEVQKFKNALLKATKQIEKIKSNALKNLSEKEASVFDAHIQIVQDPVMTKEIEDKILQEKTNAVFATKVICDKYASMFEAMDDAYMKERASDVKDVSKRIINVLSNVESFDIASIDQEVIIVAHDLTPSETALLNKKFVKGFATNIGGATSHAAIIAKSLGIPAVLGVNNLTSKVKNDQEIAIDGNEGLVYFDLSSEQKKEIENKIIQEEQQQKALELIKGKEAVTIDNHKVILAGNVAKINDVNSIIENDGQAIGLTRSEFLYMENDHWPTEEEQFTFYKDVIQKMNQKQVIVRTLDIGGDKKLSYYNFPEEMNPFLGYRAIRLSLDQEQMFRVQLRALIRASFYGKLGIMFPMIATISEFKKAKSIFLEEYKKLNEQKVQIAKLQDIEVGMMVELPSAAILVDTFAKYSDFFSIGTNDLIQYTMAADRMSEKVAYLYQPLNPSILRTVKMIIDKAHSHNKWVGMCGEMASDKNAIPLLLGMGLDEFSMSSNSILRTKMLISNLSYVESQKLVEKALELETEEEVIKLVKNFINGQK